MQLDNKKHISFAQSKKQCIRQTTLRNDVSWSHYTNAYERLFYNNEEKHTLSMYLNGGYETVRTDIRSTTGAPGKFCLMPEQSESKWQIGVPQEFIHLYFSDQHLKLTALKVFDIDPRIISLPEKIFFENQKLENLFRHHISDCHWGDPLNTLAIEQFTDSILVNVIQNLNLKRGNITIKGGLAPKTVKLITEFMHSHFSRQISLNELATLAELSDYHFCRMFKASFAQTPQQYLMNLRITHATKLLTHSNNSLAAIAIQCGFSNQSHFTKNFKQHIGITPNQYKRLL